MPDGVAAAPPSIAERLADQVSVPATAIVDYGTRSQTRTEHLVEVLAFEGWVTAAPSEWKAIDEFLFARALEHDSPRLLFNAACEFLRVSRIMRPGVLRLLEHVATARDRADEETWDRLSSNLSAELRQVLDELWGCRRFGGWLAS